MFGRKRKAAQPAPSAWQLAGWDRADLAYALSHIRYRCDDWRTYVPALELVPCGDLAKAAVFLKVGTSEYEAWTRTVEPAQFVWRWHLTTEPKPYVLLRLSIFFHNTAGTPIGVGGGGTITVASREALDAYGHQLVCSALFDPADDRHRETIQDWATTPGPTLLFLVEENLDNANYITLDLSLDQRAPALDTLAEAEQEMHRRSGVVRGGFAAATAAVADSLPSISWWR